MRHFNTRSKNAGFSLIEVTIVLALIALAGAGLTTLMKSLLGSVKFTEIKGELVSQRERIKQGVSCQVTAAQCTLGGTVIAVKNFNGVDILENEGADGVRIGSVLYRARCMGTAKFAVERKIPANLAGGIKQTKAFGTRWQPLFPPGTEPCGAKAPDRKIQCESGEIMTGFNLDTGEPNCVEDVAVEPPVKEDPDSGPKFVECPKGQIMKGINLATGKLKCAEPKIELVSCAVVDPGPVDHCSCPKGKVMRMFNADKPVPHGMAFKATCECCTPEISS